MIEKFLSGYPENTAEEIYGKLHKNRKNLVKPIVQTEEDYIRNWEAVEYKRKSFSEDTPELYTDKEERIRSKSELIIANLLYREGIPYRYEYPVDLKGWGPVYPDFTVLNLKKRKELYWEHFGRMDDPEYAEKAIQKIERYEQNGIFPGETLLITGETKKRPLNQKQILLMIRRYLK